MFATAVPIIKKPIELNALTSFEEKFNAICEYCKIKEVFLEVTNPEESFPPGKILQVIDMRIPPADNRYTLEILRDYHKILQAEAENYIESEDDFDSITTTLEKC